MSHLTFTALTALLLAAGLAMLENRSPRQRLSVTARVFATCAVSTVAGGWLMHFIHG
jgi:hypothetical protein